MVNSLTIYNMKLLEEDEVQFYFTDKRKATVILHLISLDFKNPKMALSNIQTFCEKLKEQYPTVMYIQHHASKKEYDSNQKLYSGFHTKTINDQIILLTAKIEKFVDAFWRCAGWKD